MVVLDVMIVSRCSRTPSRRILRQRVSILGGYYPWNGFADLHFEYDRVVGLPYGLWSSSTAPRVSQWFQIGCGLVFFLLLGLTHDARSRYARILGLSRVFPTLNSRVVSTPHTRWRFRARRSRGPEMSTSFDIRFNTFPSSTVTSGQTVSDAEEGHKTSA